DGLAAREEFAHVPRHAQRCPGPGRPAGDPRGRHDLLRAWRELPTGARRAISKRAEDPALMGWGEKRVLVVVMAYSAGTAGPADIYAWGAVAWAVSLAPRSWSIHLCNDILAANLPASSPPRERATQRMYATYVASRPQCACWCRPPSIARAMCF